MADYTPTYIIVEYSEGPPEVFADTFRAQGEKINAELDKIAAALASVPVWEFGSQPGTVCEGNDSRLFDAREPLPHIHEEYSTDADLAGLGATVTAHTGAAAPHSGHASLVAGKVPQSELPAIAITNTFVVGSQAAMLALSAQAGDVAIRTDLNVSFILSGSDPTELTDWAELLSPPDAVSSVEGRTGTVTLADIYEALTNKGTANGYPALDASALVPAAQLGGGTPGADKVLLGNRVWGSIGRPDYQPPTFQITGNHELTLPTGRYSRAGFRLSGQYQDITGLGQYWDLAQAHSININATYNPGIASGIIGGQQIEGHYSVFLMGLDGSDVPILLALPCLRVQAVSYESGNDRTAITPGDHDAGTTVQNDVFGADDALNGYRLIKLSMDSDHGSVLTISDSLNSTPDQIYVAGDQTSLIAASDWFQLVPPAGTQCLYLGTVSYDDSLALRQGHRSAFGLQFSAGVQITLNTSTEFANTSLGCVPPLATHLTGTVGVGSGSTAVSSVSAAVASGKTGTESVANWYLTGQTSQYKGMNQQIGLMLTAPALLRNRCTMWTSETIAAYTGSITVAGYQE